MNQQSDFANLAKEVDRAMKDMEERMLRYINERFDTTQAQQQRRLSTSSHQAS